MKGYYHVSSHGLEKNDIFKSREDFIAGMNDVALCVLGLDVTILCFCLMSNHFHFVLYGTYDLCRTFAEEYKRRCAMRMRYANGDVRGLKDVYLQLDLVDSQEYLENVIAYVLRNPLAAGVVIMPYHYPWSTAGLYFSGQKMNGRRLNDMSERKRCAILKSHSNVPDSYMVDDSGKILPQCYVDVAAVENIFRHPARLLMMLARKIENDVEVKLGLGDWVTLTDQEILTQLPELIRTEFKKDSLVQLTVDQRLHLCLLMKRNFGAGVKQISRIIHIDPKLVAKVI